MSEVAELPLLNYLQGIKLRDAGMLQAATASVEAEDWLSRARSAAHYMAAKNDDVTINEVYEVVGLPDRPNVAGSVFSGKMFRCIGIEQSARPKRHAGIVRRWVLI